VTGRFKGQLPAQSGQLDWLKSEESASTDIDKLRSERSGMTVKRRKFNTEGLSLLKLNPKGHAFFWILKHANFTIHEFDQLFTNRQANTRTFGG